MDAVIDFVPSDLSSRFTVPPHSFDNTRYFDHFVVAIYTKNIREADIYFDNIHDKILFGTIESYQKYVQSFRSEKLCLILYKVEKDEDLMFWCNEFLHKENSLIASLYYFNSYKWRKVILLNYQKLYHIYRHISNLPYATRSVDHVLDLLVAFYVNNSTLLQIENDDDNAIICYESHAFTKDKKQRLQIIQALIDRDDHNNYSCLKHWNFFHKYEEYHTYLRSTRAKNVIVLIVTDKCSTHKLLFQLIQHPHVYLRSQVKHIYNLHLEFYNNRTLDDTKVIHYFLDKNALYSKLQGSINERFCNMYSKDENDSQISLRNTNRIQFEMLIHLLIQMKQTPESKMEMLEECRLRYNGEETKNEAQLRYIDTFEREYKSDQAIYWYTRECFLYRIVNNLCRTENVDLLYSLRYFIGDLYRQLAELHLTSPLVTPIVVYRGQLMHMNELHSYKNNIGRYYCSNTFMSTTRLPNVALIFSGSEESDKERVQFCIEIDTHENMVPFASIENLSRFSSEAEILLAIGFTFRICAVEKSFTANIWTIKMTAVPNTSDITAEMKNHIVQFHINIQSTPSLLMLGNLLIEMNENERAEQYYRMFVETEPMDTMQLATAYQGIGHACTRQCQYATALENYELAFEICSKNSHDNRDYSLVVILYNNIAQVYRSTFNYKSTLSYYEACLKFVEQSLHMPNKHQLEYEQCHLIANVYVEQKKYSEAIHYYQRSLDKQLMHRVLANSLLAHTCYLIGHTHELNNEYCLAENYYEMAYEIERNEAYCENIAAIQVKIKMNKEKNIKNIRNKYRYFVSFIAIPALCFWNVAVIIACTYINVNILIPIIIGICCIALIMIFVSLNFRSWDSFVKSLLKMIFGDYIMEFYFRRCGRNYIPTLVCMIFILFTKMRFFDAPLKIVFFSYTLYVHKSSNYGVYGVLLALTCAQLCDFYGVSPFFPELIAVFIWKIIIDKLEIPETLTRHRL